MLNKKTRESSRDTWLYHTLTVIVLYKTSLSDSLTFRSLQKAVKLCNFLDRIDLLVCDNSLIPQTNLGDINNEALFNIYYLHDPQNPGVSLSYNRAAELAGIQNKKWLLVLDQDTTFPTDTISSYQKALSDFPNYAIYAPQLYEGEVLYSPCRYFFRRGTNFQSITSGVCSTKFRNVLNSGLLINLEAFRKVGGYNEAVQLYFSDFIFFDRLKQFYNKFIVINCHLNHQLSSVDYNNMDFALKRFAYYCKGARQASIGNVIAWLNYSITVGLRSLLISKRLNTLQFVWIFIRVFICNQNIYRSMN